MIVESFVFRLDNRITECGRDVFQGRPVQSPPALIDSQLVEDLPVAIKKERVRLYIRLPDRVESREGVAVDEENKEREDEKE